MMRECMFRVGDMVMVLRATLAAHHAACLPECVWMQAGQVMEVSHVLGHWHVRVRYDKEFFAWFDEGQVEKGQGPRLVEVAMR